jgi:formylglycine-generating enzyme required for sulfatase activity
MDGDDMTDDQRDALCNMGESLGLTGGEAEDLIDEYLEEMSNMPLPPSQGVPQQRLAGAPSVTTVARPVSTPVNPATPARPAIVAPKEPTVNTSPLARAQEKQKFPNFVNSIGAEMFLVTSGAFLMGSSAPGATPQEQPVTPVTVSCYYIARFPVTNDQYEKFDAAHRAKRAPWADGRHPVVYVNSREAEKFCQWLSAKEGRKYRLPTEAEWEFAARGADGRSFPWGEAFDSGHYANFADKRTNFAWRDNAIDDGFAETSPVGSHSRGASPFGIEDMAGNVFEWCLDFFEPYRGKEKVNPRGPTTGTKRNYRGGSWKSRMGSLRATARQSNMPEYSSNDVGFRIVCECD